MRVEEHRVPTAQLASAIAALLDTGPCVIEEIADTLGYSSGAVRVRLLQLAKEGRAHRQRIQGGNNPALFYRWHAGPQLGALGHDPCTDVAELSPVQITVHSYPSINRRDPMVAAFFGQHFSPGNMAAQTVPA
ncbi:MAG: hypothetical protein EOO81_00535 [Oxalobacteraceae bacterium]|nr:MAG: hypothetical protein EOO81_00535 [Oxalobacteraceae bacterium]